MSMKYPTEFKRVPKALKQFFNCVIKQNPVENLASPMFYFFSQLASQNMLMSYMFLCRTKTKQTIELVI